MNFGLDDFPRGRKYPSDDNIQTLVMEWITQSHVVMKINEIEAV
jgi:hypothetical protein